MAPERRPRLRLRSILRTAAAGLAAVCVALPLAAIAPAPAVEAAEHGAPDDIAAEYYGALLRHTRWAETVWDQGAGVYQARDFNFGVVLGNAVLLTHGQYDATVAGVSEDSLRQKTIATIRHYAARNRNVDPAGTWGRQLFWDSTFQSYFLVAGRLMWDELDEATRDNLTTIATSQSAYTSDLDFGRDPLSGGWTADWPTGKHEGDTAQEEAGVYTQALAPGLAWAPEDADAARWAEQLADWGRNAGGQPTADLNNPAVVAGKPISSNTMQTIHDTYLVENHGSFGPHYQSDIWRSGGRNAIHFLLNDQPLPEILTRQPNSAELWETIRMTMSAQGEPFMPMVADREFLYGRDVLPIAYLGQVLRDPDAVRAEAQLAAALEEYQAYAPVDRLTKFSGEPKYEPEARAEIAISYLLHVEAAESDEGIVAPTPEGEFFARLAGVRDFGSGPGLTLQQSERAWAAAASKRGFVKFPWVPDHDSWLFHVSGSTPYLYPRTGDTVDERRTSTYVGSRDGFEGTASMFRIGEGYAGQVTLPTGSAVYGSSGSGPDDGALTVRNLDMDGYAGLDGSRTYLTAEGQATGALPVVRPADPVDARAARVDDLAFAPVEARYVRMQGQQGNAQYGYSMHSFHVYGSDPSSPTDLASGRIAQASSEDAGAGRTAARVTDRDAASRWAVSTADRTRADSWIQVDLGAAQTVGAVRLAWEASAGARYLVQTSVDGVTWTTQRAYGGAPADVNVARMDTLDLTPAGAASPGPVDARYVRMQGVQGNPEFGYSLFHLRAFTPSGVDAAAGKPATASSADTGRAPSSVTDGTAASRWAVARDQRTRGDSWVQVDLGAPTAIAQVQLGWESAAGRLYRVQTSLDGTTWHDAASFRFTGDEIISSDGDWLSVEDRAGFVVRGSGAPIRVTRETEARHVVRLVDAEGGAASPFLVEMVPGDAAATAARAEAPQPESSDERVLATLVDGYLVLFNMSEEAASPTITVPHDGDEVPIFVGTQRPGAAASELQTVVPAGSAVVLAPRFSVAASAVGAGGVEAEAVDGRTVRISGGELDVRNLETDTMLTARPAAGASASLRFVDATPFPVQDLALERITFPASVLPEGMTSPALAVDGDPTTTWVPGPDGRMVVDLGEAREIGSVVTDWAGEPVPGATVSLSDDGRTFREVEAEVGARAVAGAAVPVGEAARYVALSTTWSAGDAAVASLRVLPPGVVDDVPPAWVDSELAVPVLGEAYDDAVRAEGVPSPVYLISSGELPAGLALDAETGRITGVATEAGAYAFEITADNGVGLAAVLAVAGSILPTATDPGGDPDPEPGTGEPGPGGEPGGQPVPGTGAGDGAPAPGGAGGTGDDPDRIAATGVDASAIALAAALLLGLGFAGAAAGARMRRRAAR